MRSIWKTIIRSELLLLSLILALAPLSACAGDIGTSFSVGMISVKTTVLNPLLALERDFQSLHSLIYESLITLNDVRFSERHSYTRFPNAITTGCPSIPNSSSSSRIADGSGSSPAGICPAEEVSNMPGNESFSSLRFCRRMSYPVFEGRMIHT